MTRHQKSALLFIRSHIAEQGVPPTVREIAAATGQKSISGAHRLVEALVRRGFITRTPLLPRSIGLVERRQKHICSRCGHTDEVSAQ